MQKNIVAFMKFSKEDDKKPVFMRVTDWGGEKVQEVVSVEVAPTSFTWADWKKLKMASQVRHPGLHSQLKIIKSTNHPFS